MQTSARNRFDGRIAGLQKGAVNTLVTVDIGESGPIVANITNDSAERLGLTEGGAVTALIKATSVLVTTETENRTSARNFLSGKVSEVATGTVNSVVTIDLFGGGALTATVTKDSVERLGLAVEIPAAGLFKASAVILMVGD